MAVDVSILQNFGMRMRGADGNGISLVWQIDVFDITRLCRSGTFWSSTRLTACPMPNLAMPSPKRSPILAPTIPPRQVLGQSLKWWADTFTCDLNYLKSCGECGTVIDERMATKMVMASETYCSAKR